MPRHEGLFRFDEDIRSNDIFHLVLSPQRCVQRFPSLVEHDVLSFGTDIVVGERMSQLSVLKKKLTAVRISRSVHTVNFPQAFKDIEFHEILKRKQWWLLLTERITN